MARLPDYESNLLPCGSYVFTVAGDPVVRKKINSDSGRVTKWVIFTFSVEDNDAAIIQHFFPWKNDYKDLAVAFGAPEDDKGKIHMSRIEEFDGLQFDGDIIHEPSEDKKNTYMRVVNIRPFRQSPPGKPEDNDDDLPF